MKQWLVGLTCVWMGLATAMGDLTSPATLPVEYAGANSWSNAALDALTGWDATGLGSPYGAPNASAKMDAANDNIIVYFDGAASEIVYSLRRSDGGALTNAFEAKLQESADTNSWSDVRTFDGSELNGTLALFTNALSSSSRYVRFIYTVKASGQNFGLGYVKIGSGGSAQFSVTLDKSNGFTVDQGSSSTITATAANGTAPYTYGWGSTLGGSFYTAVGNVFTILATAPTGSYSATATATDSVALSTNKTVTFSVVAAATKYAITIIPPVNGTVATTPATEAAGGTIVTIQATPAGGYAVDTYSVVGADTTVIGTTSSFIMPDQAVTVTVTFKVHVAGSLIISEVADPSDNANARFVELYNAGVSSIDLSAGTWYLARQANGGGWANVALTGTIGAAQTYVLAYSVSNFPIAYPAAPAPNQSAGSVITGNGDDGYFLYSGGSNSVGTLEDAYGVLNQDGTGTPWEYTDGRGVRNAGVTAGNPSWTASEWTVTTGTVATTGMTPGVHPEGAAALSVTLNKLNGFTVAQGASDTITATAVNGTAPYTYAWSSSLGASFYSTNANMFTILATAPTGSYSATVTATDNAAQNANNTVTFSVVSTGGDPEISQIIYTPGTGVFSFPVPVGRTLSRVQGAGTVVSNSAFAWSNLTAGVDYTVTAGVVALPTTGAAPKQRMIRVWVNP
jgi:hypothetical protein